MVYEKRVGSVAGLRKELRTLDSDAGVRVRGTYGGRRCLAFVTRFEKTYTVVVYAARGTTGRTLGEKLASREFNEVDHVVGFLTQMAAPKPEAFIY